jgi:hypothetical protein
MASSDQRVDLEQFFLFQFKRRAHHYLSSSHIPEDDLEWLALMQHYGAPSRLLDFTRSPWIAAFFALEKQDEGCDAAVWAIDGKWCTQRAEEAILDPSSADYGNPSVIRSKLTNPKKLGVCFREIFFDTSAHRNLLFVLPVEPYKMNQRLTLQQGLFLCPAQVSQGFVANLVYGDSQRLQQNVKKLVIKNSARRLAMIELFEMNITRAALFPGLDGFAQSLTHQIYSGGVDQLERIAKESFIRELKQAKKKAIKQATKE